MIKDVKRVRIIVETGSETIEVADLRQGENAIILGIDLEMPEAEVPSAHPTRQEFRHTGERSFSIRWSESSGAATGRTA